jgi:hypothetical protein
MPMITGAHSIIHSTNPEADRAFIRDVLGLSGVDAGGGWLIFGLPAAEVAVHPSEKNDVHELYLLCDDVEAVVQGLAERKVACGPVEKESWGLRSWIQLPAGGRLGVYEPRHARPNAVSPGSASVWLPIIALFGLLVPNGYFVYWLVKQFNGFGAVLHDHLAMGFILDAALATGLLCFAFARAPIGRIRWPWFLLLSLIGGLGFGLPLYWWLNQRRGGSGSPAV